eukprot:TRINITY_DN954_c0_g1_i1.p1 TRINITY_DN954_c0_g1~~TRINITY_DN954_c0_g1_i1.p1  ORF type:complete len:237 (-),score=33.43 TRINITY_DN954_c0_g1_i1:29-739(-)
MAILMNRVLVFCVEEERGENYHQFSWPGFESMKFHIANYSLVSPYLLFDYESKRHILPSQWAEALRKNGQPGRSIMTSTPDFQSLTRSGGMNDRDLAKQLMELSQLDMILHLSLTEHLYKNRQNIFNGSKIEYSKVFNTIEKQKRGNKERYRRFKNHVYHVNPDIVILENLPTGLQDKGNNTWFILDPLHFIFYFCTLIQTRQNMTIDLMARIRKWQQKTRRTRTKKKKVPTATLR